ncbi:glycosyltransferase [candidate division WWE3 bacterium]|uniref:Glycosyltransferase n=1 Tax=candidate division WWE3 bacterium TaxID=2053526 RepID=A0A955RRL9_UNCKA|nr:glycosyltransferase [candidate division WWE3 bacterium]
MNILFAHDYPPIEGGGLEVNTFAVASELTARGNAVTIITSRRSSETFMGGVPAEQNGVQIRIVKDLQEVAGYVQAADVICPQMTFSLRDCGIEAIRQALAMGKVVIVSQHTATNHIPYSNLQRLSLSQRNVRLEEYRDLLNNEGVAVVAPSIMLADDLTSFGVVKDITIIPIGIEQPNTEKSDKKYDLVTVGEVSYLKGLNYLCDSIRLLKNEGMVVTAAVAGGGSEFELVKALASSLEIADQIDFLGYIPHKRVNNVLAQSRVMVHPSLSEVMPLVIIEAMLMNVPVVASNVGFCGSLLKQSGGGVVFERGDVAGLAASIKIFLSNERLCTAMGQSGKVYCKERYTIDVQVDRLVKMIESR